MHVAKVGALIRSRVGWGRRGKKFDPIPKKPKIACYCAVVPKNRLKTRATQKIFKSLAETEGFFANWRIKMI